MSAWLVVLGAVLLMASGLPALAGRRGGFLCFPMIAAGSLAGLTGCALGLTGGASDIEWRWMVPGGSFAIHVDALAAFFAAPVFLLSGAGGLYAERYWPWGRERAGYVRVFFGLLTGSLALVMLAANTILFVAAWEIVTLASFFLVATDHEQEEVRRAAWLYLAVSHVAILALFAIVALLHALTGTWSFASLPEGTAALPAGRALFWLAVVAFGVKAGAMPFHVWLPSAHAAAPSHVSALMSGVVIKMGIYGLVRVLSLFDDTPPAFGVTLLLIGVASSVLGVAFALAQHDLKRLLAYHSIENIGIILIGLGIALVAQSYGRSTLALLGYAGALLHVWNHGLFKSLLFLSAGAAIHSAHTREIDRMGGLGRTMPWTAAAFLIGAVAITGLPPLNGFVSEWLLYVAGFTSMMSKGGEWPELMLSLVAPALALTGALALACFVKAFGTVFLGSPRTEAAAQATEAPRSMRLATVPLVAACLMIGIAPAAVAPMVGRAVRAASAAITDTSRLAALLEPVQWAAAGLAVAILTGVLMLLVVTRGAAADTTWACGYAEPTARMQYTASSIARGAIGFFAWAMPADVHGPRRFSLFPKDDAAFESHVPDTVLDRMLLPLVRRTGWMFGFARYIQGGRIQIYLLYLGVTLLVLLAWSAR